MINSNNYFETQFNVLEKDFEKYNSYKNLNVMRYYSKKITRETSNIVSNNLIYPHFTKEEKIKTNPSKLIVNIENEEKTTEKVKKIFNSVFNCDQMKTFKTPNIQYTISSITRNKNETEIHLKPYKPITVQSKPLQNYNKLRTILSNELSVKNSKTTPKNGLVLKNMLYFKNTLKKLKLGIILYGTNFKVKL